MDDYLSKLIFDAIKHRSYTYDECSKAFNIEFGKDIKAERIKPLNKDLLYRIKKNNYSLASTRVAKLCDFLNIDELKKVSDTYLEKEAYMVNDLIKEKPELKPQINSLIQNIINLTKGMPIQ